MQCGQYVSNDVCCTLTCASGRVDRLYAYFCRYLRSYIDDAAIELAGSEGSVTRKPNETKLPISSQQGVHSPSGEKGLHPYAEQVGLLCPTRPRCRFQYQFALGSAHSGCCAPAQRALDHWQARIDANRIEILLESGEISLFNNRRIMHSVSSQ